MDLILALIITAGVFFVALKSPLPAAAPQTSPESNPWIYPGAIELDRNTFESPDDVQIITDWYQKKIKEAGMTVISFIVTNTNNNIVNQLAGATGDARVNVEITKMAGENMTTITITTGQDRPAETI